MKLELRKETVRSLAVKTSVRTGAAGGVVIGDGGGIDPNVTTLQTFFKCVNHIGNGAGGSNMPSICGSEGPSILIDPVPVVRG